MLGIGKTRFSELYKEYKIDPVNFNIKNIKSDPCCSLNVDKEEIIANELRKDKKIIEDENISTVNRFNFRAVASEIQRIYGEDISYNTIRNRAISWGFHKPHDSKRIIYTEFERGRFGSLFQHDASIHKWSPYMPKFYLILTIDDHSRFFVYGHFFLYETSMAHIYAMEETILCYGIPLQYYVDKHSIFTGRDRAGNWNKTKKKKEEFEVQFKMVAEILGIEIITANSANAKGKIERPFRYLQDRLCRRMAKEKVETLDHANEILQQEIEYYNFHKTHRIINQIPADRYNKSIEDGKNIVRPFDIKKMNPKDIFCFHYTRSVNKYAAISYIGQKIYLPKIYAYTKKVYLHVRIKDNYHHIRIFLKNINIKNISIQKIKKS